MAGANPRSIVAVEIFIEENQITPMRIVLKFLDAAEDRPSTIWTPQEDMYQAT
jgi:hypothetical protein